MSDFEDDSATAENKSVESVDRRGFLVAGAAGLAALGAGAALAETGGPEKHTWQYADARKRFTGKTVLITGATSGIGAATVRAFAAEGASVMFCGRRENLGAEVEAGIRDRGGEATYMRADVREADQVKAFAEACVERYGGIDIGFNNAGIAGPAGSFPDAKLDGINGYHDVMKTNIDGVFYAMQYEIPVMLKQGAGIIINTASILGS